MNPYVSLICVAMLHARTLLANRQVNAHSRHLVTHLSTKNHSRRDGRKIQQSFISCWHYTWTLDMTSPRLVVSQNALHTCLHMRWAQANTKLCGEYTQFEQKIPASLPQDNTLLGLRCAVCCCFVDARFNCGRDLSLARSLSASLFARLKRVEGCWRAVFDMVYWFHWRISETRCECSAQHAQ